MSASPPQEPAPATRSQLLALGLLFGLSPMLLDLARHLLETPSGRSCLVFWILLAILARRATGRPPAETHRDGFVLIGLCAVISVVAIGGDVVRGARLALPLGVVGLARGFGIMPLRTALLACWLLPVPGLVHDLGFPDLERAYLSGAAPLLGWAGSEVTLRGLSAEIAGETLTLTAHASGFALCALLTGLVWYAGIVHDTPLRRTVLWMLGFGALFLPLQWLATLLALSALASGHPAMAEPILETAIWPIVAVLGLLSIHSARPHVHPPHSP